MITKEQIASRFPDLPVGEVIYVCSNGVVFNKKGDDEVKRSKLARQYSQRQNLTPPEKVIGISVEIPESNENEDKNVAPQKTSNKRTSNKK